MSIDAGINPTTSYHPGMVSKPSDYKGKLLCALSVNAPLLGSE